MLNLKMLNLKFQKKYYKKLDVKQILTFPSSHGCVIFYGHTMQMQEK